MKAVVIVDEKGTVAIREVPKPTITNPNQCLVKISFAALNRRDYWITKSLYPGIREGAILGSDGMGVVEEGPQAWIGKKVLINPNQNWGNSQTAQAQSYTILGMPSNGTLAEWLVVDADRLVEKPAHLAEESAAALPLAGLTAYRACLTQARITKNQRVLITGAGGGVAQFAILFCRALGAEVYVTSGSTEKIEKAQLLGAEGGFLYTEADWKKKALESGPFDVIVDSSGGNSLNDYLKVVKPGGKIVVYGATSGRPESFDIQRLFWSQVSLVGSTMGSDEEFGKMISFVSQHNIQPQLDKIFNLDQIDEALDRFTRKDHFGKVVVRIRA